MPLAPAVDPNPVLLRTAHDATALSTAHTVRNRGGAASQPVTPDSGGRPRRLQPRSQGLDVGGDIQGPPKEPSPMTFDHEVAVDCLSALTAACRGRSDIGLVSATPAAPLWRASTRRAAISFACRMERFGVATATERPSLSTSRSCGQMCAAETRRSCARWMRTWRSIATAAFASATVTRTFAPSCFSPLRANEPITSASSRRGGQEKQTSNVLVAGGGQEKQTSDVLVAGAETMICRRDPWADSRPSGTSRPVELVGLWLSRSRRRR